MGWICSYEIAVISKLYSYVQYTVFIFAGLLLLTFEGGQMPRNNSTLNITGLSSLVADLCSPRLGEPTKCVV